MGAKQSSPAANGRTRAYSGSDLPSSTSSSSGGVGSNVSRTNAGGGGVARYHAYGASGASGGGTASTSQHLGARARSVGGSGSSGTRAQSGINIPNSSGAYSSQESGGSSSSPEEAADREQQGPRLMIGSLPAHLSPHLFGGFKCPVCSKFVSSDEMDLHLVLCLTKPRVTYNGEEPSSPGIHGLTSSSCRTLLHDPTPNPTRLLPAPPAVNQSDDTLRKEATASQ